MSDREKVIRAVDSCFDYWLEQHRWLHPVELENVRRFKADALSMLREQETKQVKQVELYGRENWYGLVCKCPDCKAIWMGSKSETHFCPNCGQAVKWNE